MENFENIEKLVSKRNDLIEELNDVLNINDDTTKAKSEYLLKDIYNFNAKIKLSEDKLIIKNNLEYALNSAKNVEIKMNINKLNNDIIKLCLKYSRGTEIQNLSVNEFKILSEFLTEIMKNPTKYIK